MQEKREILISRNFMITSGEITYSRKAQNFRRHSIWFIITFMEVNLSLYL